MMQDLKLNVNVHSLISLRLKRLIGLFLRIQEQHTKEHSLVKYLLKEASMLTNSEPITKNDSANLTKAHSIQQST